MKFDSENIEYYLTPETQSMIEHLGDLHYMINDRQIEIMQVLSEACIEYEQEILRFVDTVAELDW
jgi:DNA mismatch repair ATPase MutS